MILAILLHRLTRIVFPTPVHGVPAITSLSIWWTAMLIEPLIIFRTSQTKLLSKYPLFFTYILAVWLSDVLLYFIYKIAPGSYQKWNWPTNFLDAILAFGILLEILNVILRNQYAENIVRVSKLGQRLIWATMLCLAVVCGWAVSGAWKTAANIELERNIIAIQAVFLLAALGIIFYYAIPVGRNLKGMILGYGLCLGASLVILTLRIYFGPGFNPVWEIAQPLSFWLALMIWLVTLWNNYPEPLVEAVEALNENSETLASKTRMWMRAILSFPAQAARP